MNEMIKDMETAIGEALGLTYEGERLPFSLHTRNYLAKALINANYRKIADDEIVVKESEYEAVRAVKKALDKLPKGEMLRIQTNKEYNEMLDYIFETAKQKGREETATEILQVVDKRLDLYRNGVIGGTLYDAGYQNAVNEIKIAIKNKFGIESE